MQRSLDRSISIHDQVATVMALLVGVITLIVAIGAIFGYFKGRELDRHILQAESSAREAKRYEVEAKKAAEEAKPIVEWLKKAKEVSVNGHKLQIAIKKVRV